MPISDQVMRDLREVASTFTRAVRSGTTDNALPETRLVFRVLPELLDEVDTLRRQATLYDKSCCMCAADAEEMLAFVDWRATRAQVGNAGPDHTVRVLQPDGTTRLVCDHTFKGTSACVHCCKSIEALRAEAGAERDRLRALVAADTGRQPHEVPEVDVVSIALGPVLHARVTQLVDRGIVGTTLASAAQTMFILGMLDAEGMSPEAYVGEPKQHVAAEAAFVRFALPHVAGDARRVEVLRDLFAWLHAWLADDDVLLPAADAALAALPR